MFYGTTGLYQTPEETCHCPSETQVLISAVLFFGNTNSKGLHEIANPRPSSLYPPPFPSRHARPPAFFQYCHQIRDLVSVLVGLIIQGFNPRRSSRKSSIHAPPPILVTIHAWANRSWICEDLPQKYDKDHRLAFGDSAYSVASG